MECPSCRAPNEDDAAECFTCGSALSGATPIKLGDTIAGRYVVRARIGRGGMGTVYRAHDGALEEDVALKVMAGDAGLDPDLARRFRSEIRLARKIAHRNVCRIYEYGEEAGRRFISMELIEGTDIRKLLREHGPLPPADAYDVAIQVAHGLAAIHEAGIVHRDLKTPNIMRDRQGRVKVMDFGIAKRFELGTGSSTGVTGTGNIVGTPEYMSPEQARAEKIDARSDIYAFGIVVFELFTGDVPFRADTPMAVLLKHLHDPPPIDAPSAALLPRPLRAVLRRALAKQASDRHASMRELIADLERARAAEPLAVDRGARPGVILGAAVPDTEGVPLVEPTASLTSQPTPTPRSMTATQPPLTTPGTEAYPTSTRTEGVLTVTPRTRRAWKTAGVTVMAAAVAALALFARARLVGPPGPPPAVAPAPLAVTINALPWARIRLLSADGRPANVPALTSDDAVTPLMVPLAQGDYDVELDNGGITSARRERIQVRPGQSNAYVFVMPGFDPDAAAEAAP